MEADVIQKIEHRQNSGTGTRQGGKKLGWWRELSGFSTGVLRDPVVCPLEH